MNVNEEKEDKGMPLAVLRKRNSLKGKTQQTLYHIMISTLKHLRSVHKLRGKRTWPISSHVDLALAQQYILIKHHACDTNRGLKIHRREKSMVSIDGAPTSNEPGPAAVSLLRNQLKQQPHVM